MATKTPERKIVDFATLVQVDKENVRDSYVNIPGLATDERENWKINGEIRGILSKGVTGGLAEPMDVEEMPDGKLHIRRGHRRYKALALNNQMFPNGWQPEGSADIYKFDKVEVFIYKGLTALERFLLTADHGNRDGLESVGVCITLYDAWDLGMTERQAVNMLRNLIDATSPMDSKTKLSMGERIAGGMSEDVAYLQARKGWIDVRKRVFNCPFVVREAYFDMLRGKQAWPTSSEVTSLLAKHQTDFESDKMNVSRANPGPVFLKGWDELVAAKKDSGSVGNKPKSKSMLGAKDMEDIIKTSDSPLTKTFASIVNADLDRGLVKLFDVFQTGVGELLGTFDKLTPEEVNAKLTALRGIQDNLFAASAKPAPATDIIAK